MIIAKEAAYSVRAVQICVEPREKKQMNMVVLRKDHILLRTGQPIPVNGLKECVTDMELNCGQMAHAMKECGKTIKLTGRASLFMLMVISTKVNGSMTKLRELAPTPTPMGPTMKDNGLMINSMDRVWNLGQMALDTKVNMRMERKKDKVD